MELFPVIVRTGFFDLDPQLLQPVLDSLVVAPALDNRGLVFGGDQPAGRPQQGKLGVLNL